MTPSRLSAMPRALSAAAAVVACGLGARGSLVLNTGAHVSSHVGNLVVNGSFEIGAPTPGVANQVAWATGTALTPFAVPTGWTSSGTASTYASWGSDGPGLGIEFSAPFPDGSAGLYFGNFTTQVNMPPTFNSDGTVSFAGTPTFTPVFGGTCTLEQVVHTELSPAASYSLNFWVSGEDATMQPPPFWAPGIFGLQVTNVLPGDPITFLSCPSDMSASPSHRFEFFFTPINSALPVTVRFINWGHVTGLTTGPAPFATELVLDDVIVNVPSPATLPLLGGVLLLARRRRGANP